MSACEQLPKHQLADIWADQLDEQLYWMEPGRRRMFLESVLAFIVDNWSPRSLAICISDDMYFSELLAKEINEIVQEEETA